MLCVFQRQAFSNPDSDASYGAKDHVKKEAKRVDGDIEKSRSPVIGPATREGGPGDRLVVEGYDWLLRHLISPDKNTSQPKRKVDIKTQCVVSCVHVGLSSNSSKDDANIEKSSGPNVSAEDTNVEKTTSGDITVTCTDGSMVKCKYLVCAVPLGVLKSGKIQFSPGFSENRLDALSRMEMGAHNKVVIRFDPKEVFWPFDTPQLNCTDQRFQFLNLHAYGKLG